MAPFPKAALASLEADSKTATLLSGGFLTLKFLPINGGRLHERDGESEGESNVERDGGSEGGSNVERDGESEDIQ